MDKQKSEDLSTPGGPDSGNVDKSTSPQSDMSTGAITVSNPAGITDDVLANIKTFEDAFAAVGESESFEDYGTGFDVLTNKAQLIDVAFLIVEWRFNKGDNGAFVSAAVVTEDGRKLVLNDGSTGLRDQLIAVTRKRIENGVDETKRQRGLLCKKGLRVSQYTYTDKVTGDERPAETFYLA